MALASSIALSTQLFQKNRALLLGLFTALGVALCLVPHVSYIPVLLLLGYLAPSRKIAALGLFFTAGAFLYTHTAYTFPQVERAYGSGMFHIDSLSRHASPFHRSYLLKGSFTSFTSDKGTWQKVPCRLFSNKKIDASSDLMITGELIQKDHHIYVVKAKEIRPVPHTFSLAEFRFGCKEKLTELLEIHYPHKATLSFLTSMLTGEIDDRVLSLEFNRLGLQHILGVSGFQFVLLTSLLGLLFRLILPYRLSLYALLAFLSLYFLFLGDSPPVTRAFISISVFIIGLLIGRKSSPINALGFALMSELLLEPLVLLSIGFQLSFICTLAILVLYPQIRSLFPPMYSFTEVASFNLVDTFGAITLFLIRETLALNLAVHLLALPILLVLFGKFPLLSLFYNLFFPLGASLAFMLSLIALFFSCIIPPLGALLHAVNAGLTKALLTLTSYPPASLEYTLRCPHFPFGAAILITAVLLGAHYRKTNGAVAK